LIVYGEILKRFSFSKKKRLVNNRQFKAVLARKLRVSDGLLTLYMAENDCGYARLGVSVSRSCGGAVVRNRLKRLLREAFRQNQGQIPAGFDYLLMISPDWPKKEDKATSIGTTLRSSDSGLRSRFGGVGSLRSTRKTVRQPTFEQIQTSFLALVAAAENRIKAKSNNR